MKTLRWLLLVASHVTLGLVALDRLLSGLWGLPQAPLMSLMPQPLVPQSAVGVRLGWLAALALVVLYWVAGWLLWRRRAGALRVRTVSGETVMLHPGAILKFARAQIEQHPAVVSQMLRVRPSGSAGFALRASVVVRPIATLPEIRQDLEQAVRHGFRRVLGIDKIDDISIVLNLDERDLAFRPGTPSPTEPPPEPPIRSVAPSPGSSAPSQPATTQALGKPDAELERLTPSAERADEPPAPPRDGAPSDRT